MADYPLSWHFTFWKSTRNTTLHQCSGLLPYKEKMLYLHNWLWFRLQHWNRQHLSFIPEWNPVHSWGVQSWHSAATSLTLPKGALGEPPLPHHMACLWLEEGNATQPCRRYTRAPWVGLTATEEHVLQHPLGKAGTVGRPSVSNHHRSCGAVT